MLEGLETESFHNKIPKYKPNRLIRVSRMENNRIVRPITFYKPREYRSPGRFIRKLRDEEENSSTNNRNL